MTTGGAMPSTGAGGSGRVQTRMTKSDSALASCVPPETSAKEWISPVRINSPAGVPSAVFSREEIHREKKKNRSTVKGKLNIRHGSLVGIDRADHSPF